MLVIKRDTTKEEYDAGKVERVVMAAGLNEEEAKKLSSKITSWLKQGNRDEVSSLDIRDQVLKELDSTNEYAAGLFRWYQKTKEETKSS